MVENLKALAVFAKTVEHRSFREAARVLQLSPSVVSHHVSELERRLGAPLLYRSTRHLALTADGERLYESAREMLAIAERGFDAASGRATVPRGRLRITAPALLAATAFSRDLAEFMRAHPKVEITMAFTELRHDLLREGFDLAIRMGRLEDSSLKVRRLAVMPRVLVASAGYARARSTPRSLRDLATWDHLQLGSRPPAIDLIPPGSTKPQSLPYQPRAVLDSVTAIRELVIAGVGVSQVPEIIVRSDLARRRVVEVLPGWKLPQIPVYAVWPGGTSRPELTQRFVEFIEPRLATLFDATS
jgi:DNA-binding transcriptional LysR family regulator